MPSACPDLLQITRPDHRSPRTWASVTLTFPSEDKTHCSRAFRKSPHVTSPCFYEVLRSRFSTQAASLPAAARLQRTPFPAAPFAVLKRSTGSLGSVLRLVFAVPAAGPVCPVRATHLIKADGRGERASRWTQGSPPPCRLARRVRKGRCSQDAGSDLGGDRRPLRSRRLQAGQHRPAEMVNE